MSDSRVEKLLEIWTDAVEPYVSERIEEFESAGLVVIDPEDVNITELASAARNALVATR